jgi:PAS domain S-box-containing protein
VLYKAPLYLVIKCPAKEAGFSEEKVDIMNNREQPLALVSQETDQRIHAEDRLRQSDELFRLLIESVKDYAIFLLEPNGNVLTWNPGAERIKGYKADEIIGKHFSQFYPREAVESKWPERELEIASREGRFVDEGLRVRKDGSTFWANVVITAMRDEESGELRGFSKVTRDLTERRALEEASRRLNRELRNRVSQLLETQRQVESRTLALQRLSSQLTRVKDEESRRISRSLHDDLGQHLTALKLELESQDHNKDLARAIRLTDESLQKVRSLSYMLHPPLLDETGLIPALHWYIEGMQKRTKMRITFDYQPSVFPRLSREIEISIFRVIQESLTNVYRHSGSEDARIDMNDEGETVRIRIRDFGKGIESNIAPFSTPAGVGLSGMRERVKQLNGELKISRAEPGTLVDVVIPKFDEIPNDFTALGIE